MVSHGHITVDNKKVNIPSFRVKVDATVAISSKFVHNTQVRKNLEQEVTVPGWLERKGPVGRVLRVAERDELEQAINEQLIVEFYSR